MACDPMPGVRTDQTIVFVKMPMVDAALLFGTGLVVGVWAAIGFLAWMQHVVSAA